MVRAFALFGLITISNITSADTILYIGDSHSRMTDKERAQQTRRFGTSLTQGLESKGHKVDYFAICGATPQTWATGSMTHECSAITTHRKTDRTFDNRTAGFGPFSKVNDDSKAGAVIINLGDNLFDWQVPKTGPKIATSVDEARVQKEVQQLLKSIRADQKCVWITPCYHPPGTAYSKPNVLVDRMYKALKEAINDRCTIVDSRPFFSATHSNDGLHFTDTESAQWGAKSAAEVNAILTPTVSASPLTPASGPR